MLLRLRSNFVFLLTIGLFSSFLAASANAVPLTGAMYPAPGGNSADITGDRGDAGGSDVDYYDFAGGAQFITLYWGPQWDASPPTAWLDGSPDALSFTGVAGATVTWDGVTDYTAPVGDPNYSDCTDCPIRMEVTITSGAVSWVTEASVPGLTALSPGIGAVIDNSAGVDFTVNIAITADVGNGYEAINDIHVTGGGVGSSVSGAFYSQVPEPSTAMLLAAGLGLMAARRRR